MSKEYLEALEELKNIALSDLESIPATAIPICEKYNEKVIKAYETLQQALIKAQEMKKILSIIKEKPYESAPTINYIKINKDNPKMLNYEHYCMTVKDKVNESEFVLLCEVNKYE